MLAPLWWEVGRRQEAIGVLDRFAADGFAHIPMSMMWLHTMCPLAEVAAAANRAAEAQALLDQLASYVNQLAADPAVCAGSVAHYCGLLATVLQDWKHAESWFQQAICAHERLGAQRWANRTRLAHARLLLTRDEPGDPNTADELLRATAAAARHEGQSAVARACEDLRRVPVHHG